MAGLIGLDRLILLGRLPAKVSREQRRVIAVKRLHKRIAEWGGGTIPSFGKALGVRVRHEFGTSVAYDLEGKEAPELVGGYGGSVSLGLR